jgi:ABC-type transporter Mla MlaB component
VKRRNDRDDPGGEVVCDVSGVVDPDAATIEALARLQLSALRAGRRIRIEGAGSRLTELLALTGLDEVLAPAGSGVEPGCQAEEGEQPLGVEERVDPDDPTG